MRLLPLFTLVVAMLMARAAHAEVPPARRGKPVTPVLTVQVLSGTTLGQDLLEQEKPTLVQDQLEPDRWLLVNVIAALLPAGEAVLEKVTLTVVQGKHRQVLERRMHGLDGDVERMPFLVQIQDGCAPIVLSATAGKRKSAVQTVTLVCK
jgi:hypothetical protein